MADMHNELAARIDCLKIAANLAMHNHVQNFNLETGKTEGKAKRIRSQQVRQMAETLWAFASASAYAQLVAVPCMWVKSDGAYKLMFAGEPFAAITMNNDATCKLEILLGPVASYLVPGGPNETMGRANGVFNRFCREFPATVRAMLAKAQP